MFQLYNLETMNPWVMDTTDIIWKSLLKREYPMAQIQESISWRETFANHRQAQKEKQERIAKRLQELKKESQESKDSRKCKVLEKPPKGVRGLFKSGYGTSKTTGKERTGVLAKIRKQMQKEIVYHRVSDLPDRKKVTNFTVSKKIH
ncbi:hypothetical protein HK103_006195 [Boothiomyces macroporosus]|uniref:Uncharacterized protein n=1 Tax=Boothiomyces macroporosus TaxID=261099 RepID=A0AAD5UI66_9FUNG|nr:hypothetical protein HK103_006195 [Boothiomyces macroporosus]